ncbi:hypothetical protein JCM6882_003284 [Rhodosporidiobolus microsporus]
MHTVHLDTSGAEPRATSKAVAAVVDALARSKKAVLLVGAGISTNAGIPDFRSQGSGLYSSSSSSSSSTVTTLKGPELFSASVYRSAETTAEHLSFIAAFKQSLDTITSSAHSSSSVSKPVTKTHDFMSVLKKRGQLLRVYTQNIDGLEGVGTALQAVPLEGVVPSTNVDSPGFSMGKGKGKAKVDGDYVQLHGSVHSVRCTGCDFVRAWGEEDDETFSAGEVGACPRCDERATIRQARGQRSLSSLRRSFLRPSITLYDEAPLSALTIGSLSVSDLSSSPDFMIVMGTSLKIPGFKKLVKEFGKAVKAKGGLRVLVNRDEMGGKAEWKDVFDYQVIADTDSFVTRILTDWKQSRPRDWVGKQATLGQMFATGSTKRGLEAAPKARKPLAARSTNLPTPIPSNVSSISTGAIFPFSPSKCPALPLSDAPAAPSRKHPLGTVRDDPPSKRARLSDSATPRKGRDDSLLATPTTQRTTRTALRAAATALPSSPSSVSSPFSASSLPRLPSSPPRRRSAAPPSSPSRSPLASPPAHFYRPTEAVLRHKITSPFKPPRRTGGGAEAGGIGKRSRVARTPSPCPEGVVGGGAEVSPDLW